LADIDRPFLHCATGPSYSNDTRETSMYSPMFSVIWNVTDVEIRMVGVGYFRKALGLRISAAPNAAQGYSQLGERLQELVEAFTRDDKTAADAASFQLSLFVQASKASFAQGCFLRRLPKR